MVAPATCGPKTFIWPVVVPEQRVSARLVVRPDRLGIGETFTATLHNDAPTELMTGVDYVLERHVDEGWRRAVDPSAGNEISSWRAIGLAVPPGGSWKFLVDVPQTTHPGLHRIIKNVSAETAKVQELRLVAEFTVIGPAG